MPVIFNRYRNDLLDSGFPIVLNDGDKNSSTTSITFIGRRYANYGEIIQENLLHMLEHFAGDIPPDNPITGQIWYDTSESTLKFYTGSGWERVKSEILVGTTLPSSASAGELFFLESGENAVLYVYNGSNWIPVFSFLIQPTMPSSPKIGTFWYDTVKKTLFVYLGTSHGWLPLFSGTPSSSPQQLDGSWNLHRTSGGYTVCIIEANGSVVGLFSSVGIPATNLGTYTLKSGTTVPLSSIFPNGVYPGFNFPNSGTYHFTANEDLNISVPSNKFLKTYVGSSNILTVSQNNFISYVPIEDRSTSYTKIAVGTSSQRPSSPLIGSIRYNLSTGDIEFFDGTWIPLASKYLVPTIQEIFLSKIAPTQWSGNHGLGSVPKMFWVVAKAKINVPGFGPGSEILLGQGQQGFDEGSGTKDCFMSIVATNSSIFLNIYTDGDTVYVVDNTGAKRDLLAIINDFDIIARILY